MATAYVENGADLRDLLNDPEFLASGEELPTLATFTIRYDEDNLKAWFNSLPNPRPPMSDFFRGVLKLFVEQKGTGDLHAATSPARQGRRDHVQHVSFRIDDGLSRQWLKNQSNMTASLRCVVRWYIENYASFPKSSKTKSPHTTSRPVHSTRPPAVMKANNLAHVNPVPMPSMN